MARTIRTKVYKFNELSQDAQQTVIDNNYFINVDFNDWFDGVYIDAENIGLKIKEFDIDRGSYVKAVFTDSAQFTANKILQEHGESCETYQTAKTFLAEWAALVEKYSDGINTDVVAEDNEYDFDTEADELEREFLRSLSEDYRIILSNEYDYLTSEEAIKETIISNEYEFTKDGKRF